MTNNPNFQDAEALRKSGKYDEALRLFEQMWQQTPNGYIGWRYAFCLRKCGRLQEAEKIARTALENFSEDTFTKAELSWILYEKELKPAKEESDLGRIIYFANQILSLNSSDFVIKRVALTVMKVAKARGKWEVVLEWANKLTPENLDNQAMSFDGKRGMSERETWYIDRARALLELEDYDDAYQFSQRGLAEFPDEVFLRRTAALARARSGDLAGGITEMYSLLEHRRAEWYMKTELAELEYLAGHHTEAYRLICDALLQSRQSDEFKIGSFVILAGIALALNKLEVAAAHVALAISVRASQGWRIPPELSQLKANIHRAFEESNQIPPEIPQDTNALRKLCYRYWLAGKDEGLQFYRGTVKPYPEGRQYTYIQRDDGEGDVFVVVRNLPRDCTQPGSRVEFALQKSFDKKKGVESVQAVNVRCLRE